MSDWKENVTGTIPCRPFDMVDVWFRDGGLSSGFASDFYWKIDHDIADIIKYKVRDNKTETPEEKEAFDSMANNSESPNSSEWKNGDECRYENDITHEYTYIGKHPNTDGHYVFSEEKGITFVRDSCLSKPETPEQKAERERREEAAEMIQCLLDNYSECEESAINYVLEFLYECDYRKAK